MSVVVYTKLPPALNVDLMQVTATETVFGMDVTAQNGGKWDPEFYLLKFRRYDCTCLCHIKCISSVIGITIKILQNFFIILSYWTFIG